jgi:ATP-binding cassette subfamily F protein uup
MNGWEAESEAAQLLQNLGVQESQHYKQMAEISNNEKVRVMLAKALFGHPDNLLLDEPTNDLDLDTLTVLEDYLEDFPGAIIAVSHDRFFLDRITRHLFAIEGGEMQPFTGGCRSWLEARAAAREAGQKPAEKKAPPAQRRGGGGDPLRFTFREQRDLETIDDTLAALQARLEALDAAVLEKASDYVALTALLKEREEAQRALSEAEDYWLRLQEKAERIAAAQREREK